MNCCEYGPSRVNDEEKSILILTTGEFKRPSLCRVSEPGNAQPYQSQLHWSSQGTLTEGEGSVQLTSSLR
jgi:hypothetical protein